LTLYTLNIYSKHNKRPALTRLINPSALIPKGHKFRLSGQAAQLSFIAKGHKFRLSGQAAQLSFIEEFV
jgi:hypothetical protein